MITDRIGLHSVLLPLLIIIIIINLCVALATLISRLCTEYMDPATIEPILASRLSVTVKSAQ